MSPLYRIHSGGTMARTEGSRVIHYEVGHTIELSEGEVRRLNENRRPEDYRVVRADSELAESVPVAVRGPRETEIKVSAPGVQSADELRGAGRTGQGLPVDIDDPLPGVPLAELPIKGENFLPAVESDEPESTADSSDVAPDWSTYLAAVSAHEAAETLRGLGSADDVQAALDAENGEGGLRRPLVIRAGNAAIKRLHK